MELMMRSIKTWSLTRTLVDPQLVTLAEDVDRGEYAKNIKNTMKKAYQPVRTSSG
jgi:hypothetical protein